MGIPGSESEKVKKPHSETRLRICLNCRKKFESLSHYNRICWKCKAAWGYINPKMFKVNFKRAKL